MKTEELTICSTFYLHKVHQTARLWRHRAHLFREHALPCWKHALPCQKQEETPIRAGCTPMCAGNYFSADLK